MRAQRRGANYKGEAKVFDLYRLVLNLGFLAQLLSSKSWAFPELIRHGYKTCITCHSSVVGGDNLSPYGKSLAQELLSSYRIWPQESNPTDLETREFRLDLGGHLRVLQTHRDNSRSRSGRFFVMQLEGALNWTNDLWSFYGSLGRMESASGATSPSDFVYIPQWWGQTVSSVDNPSRFLLRAGRFMPGYGLTIAEHTSVNRRALNLNPGSERLNFEVALENENSLVLLDVLGGRYSGRQFLDGHGVLFQYAWQGFEGFRFGLNWMEERTAGPSYGSEDVATGVFGIFGWSKEFSQLLQIDKIERHPSGAVSLDVGSLGSNYNGVGTTALSVYSKLSFQARKGLNYFTTQEYLNEDTRIANPHYEAIGLGVQYFPVAGMDLMVQFRQEKNTAVSKEADSVLWLLAHIYQ